MVFSVRWRKTAIFNLSHNLIWLKTLYHSAWICEWEMVCVRCARTPFPRAVFFLLISSAFERNKWQNICIFLLSVVAKTTDNSTWMQKLQLKRYAANVTSTVKQQGTAVQRTEEGGRGGKGGEDDVKMHVVNPNKQHFGNSLRPLFSLASFYSVQLVPLPLLCVYIISIVCFSINFRCIGLSLGYREFLRPFSSFFPNFPSIFPFSTLFPFSLCFCRFSLVALQPHVLNIIYIVCMNFICAFDSLC